MDKVRLVVLSIDDILRIFKDYTSMTESIPMDSQADALLYNAAEHKFCLRITADSLTGSQPPEMIKFELKRTWLA